MSYRRYNRSSSSRSGRREMVAKYAGACQCGARVPAGSPIRYDYDARAIVACSSCGMHDKGDGDACGAHRMAAGAIVGLCWDCKAPAGRFRSWGAATPVYCDTCEQKRRDEDAHARGAAAMSAYCCGD